MTTVLILAGLWALIFVILGILIVRGVRDLRALNDERRAVAAKEHERPHRRPRARIMGRSGSNEN